jgi:hypothetical protein
MNYPTFGDDKQPPENESEIKGKPVSDREKLLRKAAQIVEGQRDEQYGSPEDSFNAVAVHWNRYLESANEPLQAGDVAVMMILLKIARLETGGLKQTDTWLDIAGYAACGFETQHLDAP